MSFLVGLLGEGFSQHKIKAPDVTMVIVKVLYSNFGFIWILVLFELPPKNHGVYNYLICTARCICKIPTLVLRLKNTKGCECSTNLARRNPKILRLLRSQMSRLGTMATKRMLSLYLEGSGAVIWRNLSPRMAPFVWFTNLLKGDRGISPENFFKVSVFDVVIDHQKKRA